MEVVFYLASFEKNYNEFYKQVVSLVPENERVICKSLKELSLVLNRTLEGQLICVIAAGRKQDLLDLLSIREFLRRSKLILLLPDRSDGIIEIAHTLYPRYLDSIGNDFSNIAAVLAKMTEFGSVSLLMEYGKIG
jgi:hypothetical protein